MDKVSLDVYEGQMISLIGPSGCGKTTLLKITAGIEGYQDGEVTFHGQRINRNFDWRRSVIYQDIRLFPWMTVAENVYFGLVNKGLPKKEVRKVGNEWIKHIGIEELVNKFPGQLSPGQKQMVGVARVLAMDPDLILCDEPFSSLDWRTREYLQTQIQKYWHDRKKTVIFVTHDIEEAVYMSQAVYCMSVRPGRMKEVVNVGDLAEERWNVRRDDPKVLEYASKVSTILEDEIKKGRELEVQVGY